MGHPLTFSVAVPADPRHAATIGELVRRFLEQHGDHVAEATALGQAIAHAVAQAAGLEMGPHAAARIEVTVRIGQEAVDIVAALQPIDAETAAALAARAPDTVWPVERLRNAAGWVELGREGDGVVCRLTRRRAPRDATPGASAGW